jgi:basic membrane protein A
MLELAKEYPDVIFSHGTGVDLQQLIQTTILPHLSGSLSCGHCAGLKTKTDKVGFVAAWGTDNSEVTGGLTHLQRVLLLLTRMLKSMSRYEFMFTVEGEKQAAEALIDLGCDVMASTATQQHLSLQLRKQVYGAAATTPT